MACELLDDELESRVGALPLLGLCLHGSGERITFSLESSNLAEEHPNDPVLLRVVDAPSGHECHDWYESA